MAFCATLGTAQIETHRYLADQVIIGLCFPYALAWMLVLLSYLTGLLPGCPSGR